MSNDLTKRTDPTKPERQKPTDTASRLKGELMADAGPSSREGRVDCRT
jgi:hypothetical protein